MTQFKCHMVEVLIGTFFFKTTYKYYLWDRGRGERKAADSRFSFNAFLQSISENQILSFRMPFLSTSLNAQRKATVNLKWQNVGIKFFIYCFIFIPSPSTRCTELCVSESSLLHLYIKARGFPQNSQYQCTVNIKKERGIQSSHISNIQSRRNALLPISWIFMAVNIQTWSTDQQRCETP